MGTAKISAMSTSNVAKKAVSSEPAMAVYPELKLHIDGEWIGAGKRRIHKVVNPATGGTLGELPLVDAADLDRALEATERGFRQWKRATAEERARVLKGAAQLIRQRVDHIARIATLEEGKTLAETRIEGAKDFVTIHSNHAGMLFRRELAEQVTLFLKQGGFRH